ncbi:methyltransferase domain-containing protein [Campylobacter sp.]|uniref:methyltransferase domain-containing protein n=1 Tax=Campylobacter sp. TaxID=205 RepID=UPI00270E887F|nr:class I SAM-dependent methyltransferase [Campylobacter sp.]
MKSAWDKKANSYPRYEEKLNKFQQEFFDKLDEYGVDFTDKTVIDVGCGTGVKTLHLAKMCKNVTGLDLSTKMLECMREDAKKFGISNLNIVESDWTSYEVDEIYDIAFSTMSPAIVDIKDFDKFMNAGKKRIYLWWNKPRRSSLVDKFYEIYGHRKDWFDRASSFEYHLQMQKIPFKSEVMDEVRTKELSLQEAYENVTWHLDIGNIKFDENSVKKELLNISVNENITETVSASMKLLVF